MKLTIHYLLWKVGLSSAITQTTQAERDSLCRHARGKKRLMEIGVYEGVTTKALRKVIDKDAVIFAVDPFPRGTFGISMQEIISQTEVGKVDQGRVEWIRALGNEAGNDSRVGDEPLDFIFVDGDHSWKGIESDWNVWSPRMVVGGVMAFHDSRQSDGADSERFTQEVILADPRFRLIEEIDRLTVFERVV